MYHIDAKFSSTLLTNPIFDFSFLYHRLQVSVQMTINENSVHCLLANLGCTRHSPSKLDSAMRAVSAKALNILLLSMLFRIKRDKRKSWVKWQPAFRLVKVVFVVVNRQHRVHNQTVVPVVSVVVKTKAQKR